MGDKKKKSRSSGWKMPEWWQQQVVVVAVMCVVWSFQGRDGTGSCRRLIGWGKQDVVRQSNPGALTQERKKKGAGGLGGKEGIEQKGGLAGAQGQKLAGLLWFQGTWQVVSDYTVHSTTTC